MHFVAHLIGFIILNLIKDGAFISINSVNVTNLLKIEQKSKENIERQNNYGIYRPIRIPAYYPYTPIKNHNNYYNPIKNSYSNRQQNIMDVLESVALNDDLHCVPRILCEMVSSTTRRDVDRTPSFPFTFIHLDSLLTLLSNVDDTRATPLAKFGKAFLMGYSSKDEAACQRAYPTCPSDPDRLVHYLNNHQGGLFRFFNGLQPPITFYRQQNQQIPQRRIQTKTNDIVSTTLDNIYGYDENRDKRQYAWRFPSYDDDGTKINNYKTDVHGKDTYGRKDKSLTFLNGQNTQNTQYFLPFHFPDRTGTGELIFDREKFQKQQTNNIFVFRNFR